MMIRQYILSYNDLERNLGINDYSYYSYTFTSRKFEIVSTGVTVLQATFSRLV